MFGVASKLPVSSSSSMLHAKLHAHNGVAEQKVRQQHVLDVVGRC
jgi:hypothetical protein